jgi:hypothetical protein
MSTIAQLVTRRVSASRHREFKHRVNNREPNKSRQNPGLYGGSDHVTVIGHSTIENSDPARENKQDRDQVDKSLIIKGDFPDEVLRDHPLDIQ